jgi:hypothetical protein
MPDCIGLYTITPSSRRDRPHGGSGAITNRIDRVEALGLVERLPDPSDRRGTLVALTIEGERTVDEAVVAHPANEERLVSALSPSDRRTLARLLRTLLLSEPFGALAAARTMDHSARRARRAGGRDSRSTPTP